MHSRVIKSLILICLALFSSRMCLAQQCCGDCNGDGRVSIDELIGSVDRALAGCPFALKPRIAISGVSVPNFAATLSAEVRQGQVTLTVAPGNDLSLLAISEPDTSMSRVGLLRNGDFLRWYVVEDSGQESDISFRIVDSHPGVHAITVSWGQGTTALSVDGSPAVQASIGTVTIKAGSVFAVGSLGSTDTTFNEIAFAARP